MELADDGRLTPRLGDHGYIPLRALAAALRQEAAAIGAGMVVDVGCGSKPYAPLFRGRYVGLDVATTHGQPDCVAVAEQAPIRTGRADAVISTQHLEHAADPGLVLAEAHRMLRADGTLLLSTHGVWAHHPDPHDYWRWTEEGLRRLVEQAGFRVRTVHRQGEVAAAGLLLASYPLAGLSASRRAVARRLARGTMATVNLVALGLDRVARRALPRHYASVNYLVVATRA